MPDPQEQKPLPTKKRLLIVGIVAACLLALVGAVVPLSRQRASATTIDADLLPLSSGLNLGGAGGMLWQSLNNLIYFSGSYVGMNVASPLQTLQVNGGFMLDVVPSLPEVCASQIEGAFYVVDGGANATDTVQVCMKTGAAGTSTYAWIKILTDF